MSAPHSPSDSPSTWDAARFMAEYNAEKSKRADVPKWPFDRAMQPAQGDEDLDRVRAAAYLAASCMHEAMRQKAAVEKIAQDLNSSLGGFGIAGTSSQGWLSLAKMEDPYAEWCQKALKTLLLAPGAPESWSTPLPGGGSALTFLPEGPPKAILEAYSLAKSATPAPENELGEGEAATPRRAPRSRL